MNIADVVALSKAGFTADQIMQMAQAEQPQAPAPQPQAPAPQPQVMPQPQPQVIPQAVQPQVIPQAPAPQPQVMPPAEPKPDPFQQLFEQMTGIKQAIQSSNLQNSQITGAAPQTTDDILASIIQPTKPKED